MVGLRKAHFKPHSTATDNMLAQSSFVGARLIRTTQVSKGSRRSSLIVEARRTKASAPSRSAAKVRAIFNRQLTENLLVPRWTAKSQPYYSTNYHFPLETVFTSFFLLKYRSENGPSKSCPGCKVRFHRPSRPLSRVWRLPWWWRVPYYPVRRRQECRARNHSRTLGYARRDGRVGS